MSYRWISSFAILFGMFSSCSDLGPETIDLSYRDQFPLRPGCQWRYAVHQVYNNTEVTDYVSTATTIGILHTEFGDVWGIKWTWSNDTGSVTQVVRVIRDTVQVGDYIPGSGQTDFPVGMQYVLPLSVGQSMSWGSFTAIRVNVTTQMPVDTRAGMFQEAFEIQYSAHSHFLDAQGEQWFVPGVGIVKSHDIWYFEGPPYEVTKELIDYWISP
jgi:hypothetical protein